MIKKIIENFSSFFTTFGEKLRTRKGKLLFLCYLVALFFLFLFLERVFSKVVFAFGQSVPYKFFLKVDKFPSLNDYVLLKTDFSDPVARGKLIVKKISCVPGMSVVIIGPDYYCCNGSSDISSGRCVFLGSAKFYSKKGEKIRPFNPCLPKNVDPELLKSEYKTLKCELSVPEGSFFFVNPHKDSYDSRYMGFIEKNKIISVLSPLW